MTQSFFSPNLQYLMMDFELFGGSAKPSPKVTKMSVNTRNPTQLLSPRSLDGECTITPEYIPDSVEHLCVDGITNPEKTIFPSRLVKFATSSNYESQFNYPPTLRELIYQRGDHPPPPIIYLPTSLESLDIEMNIIQDTSIFTLPPTKIINNDNTKDNPLHFVLPHRLKNLEISCVQVSDENDFSNRIDPIINCSNVEHLKMSILHFIDLNIDIRRLDNGCVMMNLGETFFGGIYRQQHRLGNIIGMRIKGH
ncbi:hypothetical protein DFA_09349 [Cavenderia fasciculata]|uniref:Uncharacterized protein n=1 Tax=Cavenderia fasciculata TaxID=261658 RepID=F4Q7D7_CACFS|nr:uncharacterized protein DFA_09349 [Cavenderia fasciculata]EGG16319.1 hypothetical protein DFA_09349 [Cavenderia fasciculata]|eukprot:XP_004354703.1 hypothetical protein DFA_09349 [Cavenderia fasciculata]